MLSSRSLSVLLNRRGIVVITALLLSVIVAMFIGAAIAVGPRTLGLQGTEAQKSAATLAAESGADYALMRLRENPSWCGNGSGLVDSKARLVVSEQAGYVWGLITSDKGERSMFRIRFNYEDGAGGADGLDNSSGVRIDSGYLSVNNVLGSSPKVVPEVDGGSFRVKKPGIGVSQAPTHGVYLAVEGLAGPGLDRVDPKRPFNPEGFVVRSLVAGVFSATGSFQSAGGAAAMSNSDFTVRLKKSEGGGELKVEALSKHTPRVRSRGEVDVSGGAKLRNYISDKGEVTSKSGILNARYNDKKVSVKKEDLNSPFYKLAWDEVKTASPSGPKLKAGTYVWWGDGTLHYYDKSYNEYQSWIKTDKNNKGIRVYPEAEKEGILPDKDTLAIKEYGKKAKPGKPSTKTYEMKFLGDVYVEPAGLEGKVKDLSIIPREGAAELPRQEDLTLNLQEQADLFFSEVIYPVEPTVDGTNLQVRWTVPLNGDLESGLNSQTIDEYGETSSIAVTPNGDGTAAILLTVPAGSSPDAVALFKETLSQTPQGFANAFYLAVNPSSGDLNLESGDRLTPQDLKVKFEPKDGQSAVLSSDGNIRLGATVKGEGGSLTSQGSIRILGAGVDLAADTNPEQGVNMYAKKNIVLSTLLRTNPGAKKGVPATYEYQKIKLKGLIYTWGDFIARLGSDSQAVSDKSWGSLSVGGSIVAYGSDPSLDPPLAGDKGRIKITAEKALLRFNPTYFLGLSKTLPKDISFSRNSWSSF